jgi:hypothetical protein
MADFPSSAFTFFFNCNKSKIEESKEDYWSKAQIPLDQINELFQWANDRAEPVTNQRGEKCVEISMKLYPRTSANGNDYYLAVIQDPPAQRDSKPGF